MPCNKKKFKIPSWSKKAANQRLSATRLFWNKERRKSKKSIMGII